MVLNTDLVHAIACEDPACRNQRIPVKFFLTISLVASAVVGL
jgi:hypothetical protein